MFDFSEVHPVGIAKYTYDIETTSAKPGPVLQSQYVKIINIQLSLYPEKKNLAAELRN